LSAETDTELVEFPTSVSTTGPPSLADSNNLLYFEAKCKELGSTAD